MVILLAAVTASPGDEVHISLWAMEASVEGRGDVKHFDHDLAPIRSTVRDLPFDTYTAVKVARIRAIEGAETKLAINRRYILYLKPLEKTRKDTLCLSIRVEKLPEKPYGKNAKPVNAFSTRVELKPGQKLKFQGLKNGDKELIIILQAR